MMEGYKDKCADPTSGNVAWLGIKSKNYIWYKIAEKKRLSLQNFFSWEADTAPYNTNYGCAFSRLDGFWDSNPNCETKVKLCTVCLIEGEFSNISSDCESNESL